jgi:hypothetical protein
LRHILFYILLVYYHILLIYCPYATLCNIPYIAYTMAICCLYTFMHIVHISPHVLPIYWMCIFIHICTCIYMNICICLYVCMKEPHSKCSPTKITQPKNIVDIKCIQWSSNMCNVKVVILVWLSVVFLPQEEKPFLTWQGSINPL